MHLSNSPEPHHLLSYQTSTRACEAQTRSFELVVFSQKIHEALDSDPNSEIVAFQTDFSKAFDKKPQYELMQMSTKSG